MEKRVAVSCFLFALIAAFGLIGSVVAFGGGGGSSPTPNPTPTPTPAQFQQGSSVTVHWSAPSFLTEQNDESRYDESKPFTSATVYVSGPSGSIYSADKQQSSGSASIIIPSDAAVGKYTTTCYAEYSEDHIGGPCAATESSTGLDSFYVYAGPRTFKQGDSVSISWYANPSTTNGEVVFADHMSVTVRDPNGMTVYSQVYEPHQQTGGGFTFTLANNATLGTYSIFGDANIGDSKAYESNSGNTQFRVIAGTFPAGTNPGDNCGTGSTCANGLSCMSGKCVQTGVSNGGACDQYRICASTAVCENGKCATQLTAGPSITSFSVTPPSVTEGESIQVSGSAIKGTANIISNRFFVVGSQGGKWSDVSPTASLSLSTSAGTSQNPKSFYQNPSTYTVRWEVKDSNQMTASADATVEVKSATPTAGTCTSFTYSDWSSCSSNRQTRTITSSTPAGCTGGNPVLSQTCGAVTPNACAYTYSDWSSCNDGEKTRTVILASPAGCTGSPDLTDSCSGSVGDSCASSNQCSSDLECADGSCEVPINPQVTSASWTNMINAAIASADKDDTVTMAAQGDDLSGQQIRFEIYKKRALLDQKMTEKTVSASSDTYASATYKPTEEGAYYFKASVEGTQAKSGDLSVSNIVSNSPPVAVISSPAAGSVHFISSTVQFTHSSYDVDDAITGELWKFGDGRNANGKTVSHQYSYAGQKQISLEITDSRGLKASQESAITIASQNGYSIFAFIEKPANNAAVVSSNLVVDYSGRQTYVIRSTLTGTSPCAVTVQCIQGQCPSSTASSPACSSSPASPISISGGQQAHSQVDFTWTFKDGTTTLSPDAGKGKVSGTKGFADYGAKSVTMQAKYTENGQNIQAAYTRDFNLFNQRQCNPSGAIWYRISGGMITESRDTLSTIACSGSDLQAGTNDDCCPQGFSCSTSGTVGCKTDLDAQSLGCSSYTTSTACSSDASNRIRNEVLWDYYNCGRTVNGNNKLCSCVWNPQRNKCEFSSSQRSDGNPLAGTVSSCTYTTTTGECIDGYQNIQIDATSTSGSDAACMDSTQVLPCGKPVVALPFFTTSQFILALTAIILIYILSKTLPKGKKRKR